MYMLSSVNAASKRSMVSMRMDDSQSVEIKIKKKIKNL